MFAPVHGWIVAMQQVGERGGEGAMRPGPHTPTRRTDDAVTMRAGLMLRPSGRRPKARRRHAAPVDLDPRSVHLTLCLRTRTLGCRGHWIAARATHHKERNNRAIWEERP